MKNRLQRYNVNGGHYRLYKAMWVGMLSKATWVCYVRLQRSVTVFELKTYT